MNFDELTDQDIEMLIAMPKDIKTSSTRWVDKRGYRRRKHQAQGNGYSFEIYEHQSMNHDNNFSCGLKVMKPDGNYLMLLRYNGGNHPHKNQAHVNPIGDILVYGCHIHRATQVAIANATRSDAYAEPTDNYRNFNGALTCLVKDAAISGLPISQRDIHDEI